MKSKHAVAVLGVAACAYLILKPRTSNVGGSIVEPIKELVSGPRGIRNNNPGNIVRTKDTWKGMSPDQSADARFVVFTAPVWGLRALARVLRKYAASGATSVAQIIGRWAPTNENDTSAYIASVSKALGVAPNAEVPMDDHSLSRLMAAIVQHENGKQPYDSSLFFQAIKAERES